MSNIEPDAWDGGLGRPLPPRSSRSARGPTASELRKMGFIKGALVQDTRRPSRIGHIQDNPMGPECVPVKWRLPDGHRDQFQQRDYRELKLLGGGACSSMLRVW